MPESHTDRPTRNRRIRGELSYRNTQYLKDPELRGAPSSDYSRVAPASECAPDINQLSGNCANSSIQEATSWFGQRYPLLTTLLLIRGLPYQATYTISDVGHLLSASTRAVQDRAASGQLPTRDLPGRAKFLADDLEEFLRNSRKNGKK
jgi:hypothetical protein